MDGRTFCTRRLTPTRTCGLARRWTISPSQPFSMSATERSCRITGGNPPKLSDSALVSSTGSDGLNVAAVFCMRSGMLRHRFPGSCLVRPQRAVTLSPRGGRLDQMNLFRLSATLSFADCLRTPEQTACQKLQVRETRIASCQVVLALGFVAHRGDNPKAPLFSCMLNDKMSAFSGFRFATRSSRAYGRVKI